MFLGFRKSGVRLTISTELERWRELYNFFAKVCGSLKFGMSLFGSLFSPFKLSVVNAFFMGANFDD